MISRISAAERVEDAWRIAFVAAAASFTLYAVLFEQGALTGGHLVFHEVFHDARHLLGIPCH